MIPIRSIDPTIDHTTLGSSLITLISSFASAESMPVRPLFASMFSRKLFIWAGDAFTIDPEKDDSQFMTEVDSTTMERIRTHINGFSDAYLHLSASTGNPNEPYAQLLNYIEPDSEMDNTLKQIFLIGDWSHNSYYEYKGSEVTDAYIISNNLYLVEYYARATVNQPAGPVELERHLRSIVNDSGDHMITTTIDDV